MTGFAALVLAAGRGTRFGAAPKMLASFAGEPLVRRTARAGLEAGAMPVIAVLGHRAEEVRAALDDLPVQVVVNARFAEGLSASLGAGFSALPPDTDSVAVLLGDMPGVDGSMVARLAAAWRDAGRPAALVPTHAGRRGNPVVLSMRLAPEILRLTGDEGAGRILRGRADVIEFAVDDPAVALDVDTPEALRQASTTPCRMAE